MRKNLFLTCLLTLFFLSASAKVEQSKNITVGSKTRSYILYVPDNVAANPSLVFSLHGASGHSTDKSPFRTSVADSKGCIVVYPQGETQYFAVFGGSTTGWAAYGEANDDLDFFKAIIEDVAKAYPSLDRNRIYCTGFSNGGMMTYSNSQTASDIFAAFASISGYPINEMHLRHSGQRPVPFLHIHGKADDFVKYSLMGTIRDNMVARNGCSPIPTVTSGAGYTKSVYAAAGGGFPYIYYEVDGMGHNDYTDKTEEGNSSLTMWNFLSQYTLTDACDKTLKWSQNPDQDGYLATEHGWQVTNRKRYVYGDATPTQNVSHSLQFEAGSHQLRIETTGTSGNTMTVKLATTDGKQVFCKQVPVGKKGYIPFSTTEYSEYTLTITKQSALDKFVSLSVYDTSAAWADAEAITSADVAEQLKTETKTIPLTQTDSSADKCSMTKESDGTTTFKTLSGGVEVVYKMLDVDVSGYDRVVVTFAAATPVELLAAFGSNQPTLAQGTTSYTYDIPSGTSTLSEIALIALWKGNGTTIKVKSVVLERDVVEEDDTPTAYTVSPIHQEGRNLVNEEGKTVVLHGVMDTPNAYFNGWRWQINWSNQYNTDEQVTSCLNYFKKLFSMITDKEQDAYCDLFRLHLDPAWTNDPDKKATNGGGENDISRFSKERLVTYLNKLYWPIIEDAMAKGLYIIVRPPGVCPQSIKVGDDYYNYLMTVWDVVSKDSRFKRYAGQVSLELANEPVDVYDAAGNKNSANALHDFFQPIVNKIRNNGYDGILWMPGRGWQADYTGYASYPITDANMGYAVHFYPGWYGTSGTYTNDAIITQFRNQVPVVDSYPVVITEVDWSPEDTGEGHYDEKGNWVVPNYGTWGTGTTSQFGNAFKAVCDHYKNISFTIEGTGLVYDIDEYLKTGKVKQAFNSKPDPDESCSVCMKWFKEWALGTADAVNDEMFSLKEGDFNPNIWETGKYSYDATKGVGTFYPGQYGFGGWHSKDGYDVSQYKTITVTFDEAPSNGVSFRIFDIDNYWTKEEDGHLWMTNCDGKYSVSMDISSIDHLYYVGFWAYGNAGGNYTKAMKIKSVTLTPKDVIVGDINCDGKVNIVDLAHLINILYTSSATNKATMDINKDGSVDKRDIDALVELLY